MGGWGVSTMVRDIPKLLKWFCAGAVRYVLQNPNIIRHIAQMTQGNNPNNLTEFQRTREVTDTFDALFFPHPTDPMITLFAKPVNDNLEDMEVLKSMIRSAQFTFGMVQFLPKSSEGRPIECVMCHAEDTHLAYLCPDPFPDGGTPVAAGPATAPGDDWWGPPDQMSKLTEGILATNPPGGRNNNGAGSSRNNNGSGGNGNNGGSRNNGGNRNNGGGGNRNNGGSGNRNGNRNNGRRN
ncbi:hypothetical protein C8R43DRAFT_186245 [Mycena crocata]|nr:hypothetical protein C8R43DRAFT_186245 [Mycena crocata]